MRFSAASWSYANVDVCYTYGMAGKKREWTDVEKSDRCWEMLSFGHMPIEPMPGNANNLWRSIHLPCGNEARTSLTNLRIGKIGCRYCVRVKAGESKSLSAGRVARAVMLLEIAGYTDIDDAVLVTRSGKPHKALSATMPSTGERITGRVDHIVDGHLPGLAGGFKRSRPGCLYLYDAGDHLVFGISNNTDDRVKLYERRNYNRIGIWCSDAGSDVLSAESEIYYEAKRLGINASFPLHGERRESLQPGQQSIDLVFSSVAKYNLD